MPKPLQSRSNLPARPNLEHLRSQAKTLLAELRRSDPKSKLADAQAAIARKNGFKTWAGMGRHVERLRSMEGTYEFESLEVDGQVMPEAMLKQSRLLIDGDRFRMESPEANYEGIFTIDLESKPHRIDMDCVAGPEAGNRSEGIFEFAGDAFKLCLGLVGSQRPERFASAPGRGHALEHLRRVEHARPPEVGGGVPQPADAEPASEPEDFATSVTPTIVRLQGEWVPLELVTSGQPLQATYLPFGSRMHQGVETKVVFGGQTMLIAKMRIDEVTKFIDYLNLAGKSKGSISRGLFRWDGDEAVFCMGAPGAPRAADFTCQTGSGRTFSRWKRKNT